MPAWALVVGINNYSERSNLAKLHGAVSDAADFADWALDPAGGGVTPERLFFWTHPAPVEMGPYLAEFMENPTQWPWVGPHFERPPLANEIMHCVQAFAELAVSANAQRLYIFFAGHGAQVLPEGYQDETHNCFMAGDFIIDHQTMGLVNCDDVKRLLKRIGPAELLLFFDCCRSKMPLKVNRPSSIYDRTADLGLHQRLGLARAAQDQKVAYEIPIGHPTPGRGAFSQLLVGALRSHRVAGQLTFQQLDEVVSAGMGDLVKPMTQVPDFLEYPKPPAIVLVAGGAPPVAVDIRISFSMVAPETRFNLVNEKAVIVGSELVNPAGHHFAVPIGVYSVELEDGSILKLFSVLGQGAMHVEI